MITNTYVVHEEPEPAVQPSRGTLFRNTVLDNSPTEGSIPRGVICQIAPFFGHPSELASWVSETSRVEAVGRGGARG